MRALIVSVAGALRCCSPPVGIGQAGRGRRPPRRACRVFPADNAWNQRVDTLPAHPSSAAWVSSIGETERLRALFSASDGIPYQVVAGSTAPASVQHRAARRERSRAVPAA